MDPEGEDRLYEHLESLIRSGRLPRHSDDAADPRGSHLAALVASDFRVPDDQMVLAALAAIEQLSGWQSSVEALDLGSREDLATFRETVLEITQLAGGALGVLDRRLAVIDAEGCR
jgi:hypothetical protein